MQCVTATDERLMATAIKGGSGQGREESAYEPEESKRCKSRVPCGLTPHLGAGWFPGPAALARGVDSARQRLPREPECVQAPGGGRRQRRCGVHLGALRRGELADPGPDPLGSRRPERGADPLRGRAERVLPQVAVDDAGDAVFTWSRSDGASSRVQTRARSAAGALSAVQNLSDPGQNAFAPQVAVDADGDAVFAWSLDVGANPQLAQARARSAAGTLSAVQNLSDSGSDALSPFPQVGVDADGDAVFTWERSDGANLRIQTRARDSFTGNLSAVQNLGLSADIDVHQVGVDADGDAVFTWVGRDGTTNCGGFGCLRVQAQARSAAGVLSAVQNLSKGGQNVRLEHQVAVDDAGDAVFTWSRVDGLNSRVQTRARSAAGTLSAVQNLSDPGQNAFAPQVAVDADGDAVFTWSRFDGTVPDPDFPCCARIQARTRSAAGTLSGVQTLSAAGQDAFDPQVGVDVAGKAVATWQRFDGTNDRIQASAGP